MTSADLLTDEVLREAHAVYEKAWRRDFIEHRNHSSEKAEMAGLDAMRSYLVAALGPLVEENARLREELRSNTEALMPEGYQVTLPPAAPLVSPPGERTPPTAVVSIALEQANFSPCRSKRGAVVFRVDVFRSDEVHVHGRGHNHKPAGDCDGSEACKSTCRQTAVHAEQYALLNAGVSADGADLLHAKAVDGQLVASGGPSCLQCSKLALASGIAGVWLYHEDGWRRYPIDEFHRLSLAVEAPPSAPPPASRSIQRRQAAQQGEPAPTFEAAPPPPETLRQQLEPGEAEALLRGLEDMKEGRTSRLEDILAAEAPAETPGPECWCGRDEALARGDRSGARYDIVCPKHDGDAGTVQVHAPAKE